MNALRFLKNRRVIYRMDVHPEPKKKYRIKKPRNKEPKTKKRKRHPKQPAESSSEKNCSQMSSEEETKESSAIKKKNAGSLTLLQNVEYANRLVKTSGFLNMSPDN